MMSGTLRAARLRIDGTEAYRILTTSAWQGAPIEIGACLIQLDSVRLHAHVSKAFWHLMHAIEFEDAHRPTAPVSPS
jgi:hypothetical protein